MHFVMCTLSFTVILAECLAMCKAGASALDICEHGDKRLNEETFKVFKKDKEMKKGGVD